MPDVFYAMEFDDFMALRKGWNNKMLHEQMLWRTSTILILSGLIGGNKVNPSTIWPHPWDSKRQSVKMVDYRGVTMSERQMKTLKRLKGEV